MIVNGVTEKSMGPMELTLKEQDKHGGRDIS